MALHSINYPAVVAQGRIGPNAVIQTVNALRELYGSAAAERLLAQIERPELAHYHPDELIDEREFVALHRALVGALGLDEASRVLARAGTLTSQYVMRKRIPKPVHWLLRILPHRLAMRLLLNAIGRHAWTFAGSGTFRYALGPKVLLSLENCLTARDLTAEQRTCTFYVAAFQGFLSTLIDPRLRVHEARCAACGAARCEFIVTVEVTR